MVDGRMEVFQGALVEAVRPCKIGEIWEEVDVRVATKKEFLKNQILYRFIIAMASNIPFSKRAIKRSGEQVSKISTAKVKYLAAPITNYTSSTV